MVFPGIHKGPICDHHGDGESIGAITLGVCGLNTKDAVPLMGPAGSISIHQAPTVYDTAPNKSAPVRRLLLFESMETDFLPVMGATTSTCSREDNDERVLRGQPTNTPRLCDVPVRVPLPQSTRKGSIYEIQKGLKHRGFSTYDRDEA